MRTYHWSWDLNEKDELKNALWALSQYRQLVMFIAEKNGLTFGKMLPEMGTDAGGSSSEFDWWMVLEYESRKLLDKYGVKREERAQATTAGKEE